MQERRVLYTCCTGQQTLFVALQSQQTDTNLVN